MKTEQLVTKAQDAVPGRVMFLDGQGELPMLEISTAWSTAEIYLHGAQVTRFVKNQEPPLLFVSQCSRFNEGQPIRGGIPIIFPWFGMREGLGQHGFGRIKQWELKELVNVPDGSVRLRFRLPECPEGSTFPPFIAEYLVTIKDSLTVELKVTNASKDEPFSFENCLHTYFEVGDVTDIAILGLKDRSYLDQVANFARKSETAEAVRISSEVDRIYLGTRDTVEVLDARLKRKIRIEKEGSLSTVVWNPWIAKAERMQDFGNDEYQRMVCVESGNISSDQISLPPGQTSTLTVKLSSELLS